MRAMLIMSTTHRSLVIVVLGHIVVALAIHSANHEFGKTHDVKELENS